MTRSPATTATTAPLWHGDFRWFFTGRLVDLAGSSMTPAVMSLTVLQASRSASNVGWVLAANVMPTLLFMLAGGVVADRWRRGRVLVTSCLLSGVLRGAMAALLLTHAYDLVAMAALAALSGVVTGFNAPALRGIVPELVPAARIQQANACLAVTRNATRVAGPAVGGLLVTGVGGGWALALDALSFALAAGCFSQLDVQQRPMPRSRVGTDLAEGWAAYRSLRWVWTLGLAFAVTNLLTVGPWQVLGPALVSATHPLGTWGAILSARAAGLVLASALMVRVRFRNPVVAGLLLGTSSALPLAALGLTDSPVLIGAAAALGAVGSSISSIGYDSTLQRRVPADKLSRVASFDDLLAFTSVPVSQAVVGPVATLVGGRPLVLACSLGVVLGFLLPLLSRAVRTCSVATDTSG